jgi:glycine cleavage system aminomethyltransferase T
VHTLLHEKDRIRDFDLTLRNPLAQTGTVWATIPGPDLPATQRILRLRRTDPGGIFAVTEQLVGPAREWCALGDNVIGVTGWLGISLEDQYRAVRTGAGAFIASAMYYLRISGRNAGIVLDMISPRVISDLPVGSARFTLFTTPAGTVDEEAVIVRTGDHDFEMSCGGGKSPGWLAAVSERFDDVTITDSDVFSFNIKGPLRLAAVQSLMSQGDAGKIAGLRNFTFCRTSPLTGGTARVLKTVIGYEVWAEQDVLSETWRQLVTDRPAIVPCAWDLLTTYRMECTDILFSLYPVDVHSGTTLWDVGCGWMVRGDDEHEFVGRKSLLESRHNDRLWFAGLRAEDTVAPPVTGREVVDEGGEFIGYVTSAAVSPVHGRTVGFAHLLPRVVPGQRVTVDGHDWTTCTLPIAHPAG